MEFIIVCLIIFILFILILSFYLKIFLIDFPQRDDSNMHLNDWDALDIAIHYLNFVLNKQSKIHINRSDGLNKGQIPACVSEQWTSIWYQANNHLVNINESKKKDLELLIINMKSKAIDLGLFQYQANQINSLPVRFINR